MSKRLLEAAMAARQEEMMEGFVYAHDTGRLARCLDCGVSIDTSGKRVNAKRCRPCAVKAERKANRERMARRVRSRP